MPLLESVTLFHLFLLLAVAVLLFPRGRPAALAGEGLLAFTLGAAALQVGARSTTPLLLSAAVSIDAPARWVAITDGILLLGPVAALAALIWQWRSAAPGFPTSVRLVSAVLTLTVLAATIWVVAGGGSPSSILWTLILGAAAVGLYQLGKASQIGMVIRYVDIHWLTRSHWHARVLAPQGSDYLWLAALVVGAGLVLLSGHLGFVVIGALLVAGSGHALAHRLWGGPRFPVLPLMAAPLIPFAVDVYQMAGAGGWSMANPTLAPLTADIEIRLLPLAALAAWGLGGLWPVHGLVPRGVLAPVGGVLLARLGAGFLPAGLFYWQPLLSPLALASVWWGALTGRRSLLVAGWGFQALVSDLPMGSRGAYFMLGVAGALALVPTVPDRWLPLAGRVLIGLTMIGIAWSLPAMLQTQVVYSLLAVVAVAVAIWRRRETRT